MINQDIVHYINETEPKPRALLAAIELHHPKSALVTCNEASECELLARYLARFGFRTFYACDDFPIKDFAEQIIHCAQEKIDILVCQNSMVSNQLLEPIKYIINYDFFEHNFGENHQVINLLSSREQPKLDSAVVALPSSDQTLSLSAERLLKDISQEAQLIELGQFTYLAEKMLAQPALKNVLALLLRNHLLKSGPDKPKEKPCTEQKNPPVADSGITRLYVSLGRQDGLGDLASLAQYLSEHSGVDLGHFSGLGMIREHSAHIEVDRDVAETIIKAIHNSPRQPNIDDINGEAKPIVCEPAKQTNDRTKYRRPHHSGRSYRR